MTGTVSASAGDSMHLVSGGKEDTRAGKEESISRKE